MLISKKYKYLEVCAGCGGLSYGLECSGLTGELLIEVDKNCVKTLKKNFDVEKIMESDMRKVDCKKYKGIVDFLVGGIPCQSYSMAGKREGLNDEEKGGLFYDYLRILDEIEPSMFMIENVEGLVSINKGETLKLMIKELEKREYNVDYKVLNSQYYNVPQKRKRLIIIGTSMDVKFEYPEPNEKILTMKDALKDVPESEGTKYSEEKKKVMELVPEGGCWINLPEDIKKKYMGNSLNSGGGKRGIARRLSWDEPSLTLTTSPCQKQTERCHPSETRPLKTREYARIQTFPDNFVFEGSISSIYKQIGNAVPCMLGYYLGCNIKKALDEITKKKMINKLLEKVLLDNNNIMCSVELNKLIKNFYIDNIINIYEEKIDRSKTTIDEIKKESDKICYGFTEEEWIEFDNKRLKDKENKIGELHEYLLENTKDYCKSSNINKSLKVDIMKKDYSVFIEIKNKYNTMNSLNKESVINKLKKIKNKYTDSLCLIGIINGKDYKKKVSENPEVWEYSGNKLFNLIFKNKDYNQKINNYIIDSLKIWIEEYRNIKLEKINKIKKIINKSKKINKTKKDIKSDNNIDKNIE
jgi:DNA (cytosine-5)-methyltransferase 1